MATTGRAAHRCTHATETANVEFNKGRRHILVRGIAVGLIAPAALAVSVALTTVGRPQVTTQPPVRAVSTSTPTPRATPTDLPSVNDAGPWLGTGTDVQVTEAAPPTSEGSSTVDPLLLSLPKGYRLANRTTPGADATELRIVTANGHSCTVMSGPAGGSAAERVRLDAASQGGDLDSIDLDPSTSEPEVASATFATGTRSGQAHVLVAHGADVLTEVTCDDLVTAARLSARMRVGV